MLGEGAGEDIAPTKRCVTRVDWFRRDPGGGTIFVKPTEDVGTARPAGQCPQGVKTSQ
jgi:hypothetical protein